MNDQYKTSRNTRAQDPHIKLDKANFMMNSGNIVKIEAEVFNLSSPVLGSSDNHAVAAETDFGGQVVFLRLTNVSGKKKNITL